MRMPMLLLPARIYEQSTPEGIQCREENLARRNVTLTVPVRSVALVLVDVWSVHHIQSFAERAAQIVRGRVAPLVESCRKHGVTVVHAPSSRITAKKKYPVYRQGLHPQREPAVWPPEPFRKRSGPYADLAGVWPDLLRYWDDGLQDMVDISPDLCVANFDYVVEDGDGLHSLCEEKGLLYLLYAGFSANGCLLSRSYGIRAMRGRGYAVFVIRDATTGVEYPDTLERGWVTEMAIREVESDHGFSVSVDDILSALESL